MLSPDRRVHGIVEFYGERCHCVPVDAVFPILHGKNGEDGTVQGLCELAGIPVIGCNLISSALCMDKYRAHKLVQAEGIAIPASSIITSDMTQKMIEKAISGLQYPLFIKPVRAGSSFGISKISKEIQTCRKIINNTERGEKEQKLIEQREKENLNINHKNIKKEKFRIK